MAKSKSKSTKKNKKRTEQDALKKLRSDLLRLSHDLKDLLAKKKEANDEDFLQKVADEIKQVDQDTIGMDDETSKLVHNLLVNPLQGPFLIRKPLLSAAISFDMQDPLHSDLYYLMEEFSIHSNLFKNQFLTIIGSLSEELPGTQ